MTIVCHQVSKSIVAIGIEWFLSNRLYPFGLTSPRRHFMLGLQTYVTDHKLSSHRRLRLPPGEGDGPSTADFLFKTLSVGVLNFYFPSICKGCG